MLSQHSSFGCGACDDQFADVVVVRCAERRNEEIAVVDMEDVRDSFENGERRDVTLFDFDDGCEGDFGRACEINLGEIEAFAELTN